MYGNIIRTRLGLNEETDEYGNRYGIILLELAGDPEQFDAFEQRLSKIEGLTVQSMEFETLIIGIALLMAAKKRAVAQSEEVEPDDSERYELEIPDTFFLYTPELIVTTGLNEVIKGENFDSFADPQGYLVQS
ncbi:MAG: hypothetical protein M0C28_41290 [Candidatus Moduliflexus flocculans]|nr:hypothetical protein [Candidatus Moduliflexus flocculans]